VSVRAAVMTFGYPVDGSAGRFRSH
jgi:hypothetical protein